MEDLLQNTQERFSTIYKFFDFPAPPVSVLPNNNVQDYDFTVKEIDCTTKNKLKEVYEPYNNRLYKMLKEDQAPGGGAPWSLGGDEAQARDERGGLDQLPIRGAT